MRLSDIKGDRVFDVFADIAAPVYSIAADPVARSFFGSANPGEDKAEAVKRKVGEALPKLLKGHKDDLVAIVAAIEGVSPEEYLQNVTMPGLLKTLYEMLTDEDLLAFLS